MAKDSQAPATKTDVAMLMKEIAKLYGAQDRWKDEIIRQQGRWKDEIIRHFDLTVETIRHDLLGANKDDIDVLKDRVTRLERHTGLVAA